MKQEIRMVKQEILKMSLKKEISGWEVKNENTEESNLSCLRSSGRQVLKTTEGDKCRN